jgi:hypothetical protein
MHLARLIYFVTRIVTPHTGRRQRAVITITCGKWATTRLHLFDFRSRIAGTRRIGAIFERRSGGAQHSTERSRLRPDQRAHNRGHSVRDTCFLMGAVRLMMNLPSPRQLPA